MRSWWRSAGPRYRRGIVLATTALAVLAVAWRLAGSLAARDETWERLQRERILRVGMDASYPPFEAIDAEGRFFGLDVDLATAIAEAMGCQPQFVNVHLDGLYDALQVNKLDLIISALPYDAMMTRDVWYSTSYFDAGQVLVMLNDHAQPLARQNPLTVAVELGSEAHQLARRLVRDEGYAWEIIAFREPTELWEALLQGSANAALCDRVAALIAHRENPSLTVLDPPLTSEPYVIAMRQDSRRLLQEVNRLLQNWHSSGMMAELLERWL
jgi:ABC-type amino acid transport substrate-binding protein